MAKRVNKKVKIVSDIYMFLVFLFLYIPIFALIIFSFSDSRSMGHLGGFTTKWYVQLFQNEAIMSALYYTISIAVIASIISTIMGTFAAIGINKMRPRNKAIMLNVNNLPILNTEIVTGIAIMSLFTFVQMDFGYFTMLISHIMFCIPYVILSVLPKLRQMPENIENAALDLGATPFYALRKVIIPQIKPGIVSGFLMAFTMSIDDFIISFFNSGNGVSNLSIEIYSMARRGIKPEINALSTLMFTAVIILLILSNKKQSIAEGGR
nr:ABC transporter permease [Peptacetobacter hominis]